MTTDALRRGREAVAAAAWTDAVDALSEADAERPLEPEDLERLATASYLVGQDAESDRLLERAHRGHLDQDRPADAARCAFWLGMKAMGRGEAAQGSGWISRARRLVEDQPDSVEHGYVQLPAGIAALESGDAPAALERFEAIAEIADRFDDPDLEAMARLGQGQALLLVDGDREGLTLLDDAMLSVQAGEVSPIPSGIIYCAVISACRRAFDVGRAQEWTEALNDWCEAQPDLVPYRGQCLIHRSEILQHRGAWSDAMEEAERACKRLATPTEQPVLGAAYYQRAELHRLRGELAAAEDGYRLANQYGHSPQPGLALLRLAQGRHEAAMASIRRALDETRTPLDRANLLPAAVEIALACEEIGAARQAADDLDTLAGNLDVPMLRAAAAHAAGAVELAEGEPRSALATLRRAWEGWRELDAPYEAGRVRVLRGRACRATGDEDGARLEFDAAREIFTRLGATPALDRLDAHADIGERPTPGGLTDREVEVLRLVASGKSNRAIADDLVISEHTVARHVQNIFTKIDVSSRTAAAAYAYEHDVV